MGIPTPNIFAGGDNIMVSLCGRLQMERAVDTIIGIVTKK